MIKKELPHQKTVRQLFWFHPMKKHIVLLVVQLPVVIRGLPIPAV